jgi:hypothetical protein
VNINGTFSGILSGNGSGLTNITVTGSGLSWQTVSGATLQAAANTGYIITSNSGPVIITLPVTANVGDVVRVSGLGAGGWKIAQNSGQSVVAGNLAGSSSLAGIYWIPREEVRNWASVASSADGTKLAAITYGALYTSADSGVTWIPQNVSLPTTGLFPPQLVSSADGTKLFALVSSRNPLYVSMDSGMTWANRRVSTSDGIELGDGTSLACSSDGTKLVAVDYDGGGGGQGNIYTSTDSGITWVVATNLIPWDPVCWLSVASSADGTKLVASGTFGIYTSTDSGVTWIQQNTQIGPGAVASSTDGTKLVAATYGNLIYTSTDSGVTWTAQTNGIPNGGSQNWSAVASSADGTKLVASIGPEPSSGGSASGQVYVSTNSGALWTARGINVSGISVASSADGAKLAVAASSDHLYITGPAPVATTTMGTAGYLIGGQNTAVELLYIGNGQWLPISHDGSILAN